MSGPIPEGAAPVAGQGLVRSTGPRYERADPVPEEAGPTPREEAMAARAALPAARKGARALALLVDLAAVAVVVGLPAFVAASLLRGEVVRIEDAELDPQAGLLRTLVLLLVGTVAALACAWFVLGDRSGDGQTPGKRSQGIATIGTDGGELGTGVAVLRRIVMVVATVLLIDPITALVGDGRTVHDRVARSRVVDRPTERSGTLGARSARFGAVALIALLTPVALAVATGVLEPSTSDQVAPVTPGEACPAAESRAELRSVWRTGEEVRAVVVVTSDCDEVQEISAPDVGMGLVVDDEVVVAGEFDLSAEPLVLPAEDTSGALVLVFGSRARVEAGLDGVELPDRNEGTVPEGVALAYDIVPGVSQSDPAEGASREPLEALGPADLTDAPRSGG